MILVFRRLVQTETDRKYVRPSSKTDRPFSLAGSWLRALIPQGYRGLSPLTRNDVRLLNHSVSQFETRAFFLHHRYAYLNFRRTRKAT